MTLYTVTISGGSAVEVYGGLTACTDYLLYAVGAGATAWRALTAGGDDQKRLLVQATRWIDSFAYEGTANAFGGTTLEIPRDDVTDANGDAMSNADQLALAERATFEAAAILAADNDAASAVDTGSNIKKLDAGGASIEFFRGTSAADGTALKIPFVLARILSPLLGASTSTAALGGIANGVDAASSFDDCDAYDREEPF